MPLISGPPFSILTAAGTSRVTVVSFIRLMRQSAMASRRPICWHCPCVQLPVICVLIGPLGRPTDLTCRDALGSCDSNKMFCETIRISVKDIGLNRQTAEARGMNFLYGGNTIGITLDETTT